MSNLSDVVGKPLYMHSLRHYNVSMYKRIGLEDDFIVYLTGWSESTGHSMISIYNDMTAKDRTWKNLDKLKNALEQDGSNNNIGFRVSGLKSDFYSVCIIPLPLFYI